jgi:hypothetical protein
MQDATTIAMIRRKFLALRPELDERACRCWAAVEARALGHGGIIAVARATGISDRTIRTGLKERDHPEPLPAGRQRRIGAGRKSYRSDQPGLSEALDRLIEPTTRGTPMAPLRWTCKSTRVLAEALRGQGFTVSATTIRRLLAESGYRLQANRKTRAGRQHPDRDGQFRHLDRRLRARQRRREPAISVDTKKKEILGNHQNPGKTSRPKGKPVEVDPHDFPDPKRGKVVPYGVDDSHENEAGVSIGISHDTAEFAVGAIRRWWQKLGQRRYPKAGRLLVTADRGGSNRVRNRLWKLELQKLADETGLIIEVSPDPPGTSKWNKIEHRLFCHITRNGPGVPLETLEIVVESIGHTTPQTGLEVHAWLDEGIDQKGRKVSDAELAECLIKRHEFHGEWNYEIHPRQA